MCFGSAPSPPPPPPPPSPPPTATAERVEPTRARAASTTMAKKRGTRQLTVRRPTLGMGGQTGTGVQLSQ
jgi:hypothetical protein